MQLKWDYLFWGIFFFGVFFFDPLLKAVGSTQTTIIICSGLVCVAIVKSVEHLTDHKRCTCCQKIQKMRSILLIKGENGVFVA